MHISQWSTPLPKTFVTRSEALIPLNFQPTIAGGRVEYADSALVRAVRNGRVLVVDEADKAPTNVTSVLRTLLDTRSMWLSGGQIFFFNHDILGVMKRFINGKFCRKRRNYVP